MRDEIVLSRAEPLGGGGYPLSGEQRNDQFLSGEIAWNQAGTTAAPGPRFVTDRMHQLWITPHGALKAAQRNRRARRARDADGASRRLVQPSPAASARPCSIGADGLVDAGRLASVADPVLGDTTAVTTYSDYRDFGGVKFPMRVRQTHGRLPRARPRGHGRCEVNPALRARRARGGAQPGRARRRRDGSAPASGSSPAARTTASRSRWPTISSSSRRRSTTRERAPVIEQVKTLAPGKPIRYVVNSHGHFDHSGGVRAAVAEGATVVTSAANVPYFERAFATPNAVRPDRMAQAGKAAKFVPVGDKLAMADAMRAIELHAHRGGSSHAESFLMVYLPQERLLIEADAFTPGAPNAPPPATPNPNHLSLIANIERLGLPVDRIVPLHGGSFPVADLYVAAGKAPPRYATRETSRREPRRRGAAPSARRRGCGAEELARARAGAAERQDRLRQRRQQLGESGDLLGALDVRRHRQPCVFEPGGARRGLDARRGRLVRAAFEVGPVVDDAAKAGRGGLGHRFGVELRRDRDVVRQGLNGRVIAAPQG